MVENLGARQKYREIVNRSPRLNNGVVVRIAFDELLSFWLETLSAK